MIRELLGRVEDRSLVIGVVGLGYVGIPLSIAALKAGYRVVGFDINAARVTDLNAGRTTIRHIDMAPVQAGLAGGTFAATADFGRLAEADAILIAVPTPLSRHREPDMSYVVNTTTTVARTLRRGQLIVLESTTYPGTTTGLMKPILEATGLKSGVDFFLAFSPEREDPGNPQFSTASIPKVVSGDGADALALADALYASLVVKTVPVSTPSTAEAVKLTENIFRAVNIALVNELKVIYSAMGIDVWEVIEAAKTKPFGFMPFYPGPGLGGHCIPIDPFYLTWKAREFDVTTRFIELAGEVNTRMPYLVVDALVDHLSRAAGRAMSGATILIVGIAYKKNVDDMRESPALKLIELIEERGARTLYHDTYTPEIPPTREHAALAGRKTVPLDDATLACVDAILIATDHDDIDYARLAGSGKPVLDTRNAMARRGLAGPLIAKA